MIAQGTTSPPGKRRERWRRLRLLALGLAFSLAMAAILIVPLLPSNRVTLEVGDVAPTDIRAPRRVTYISKIETAQEEERAASAVQPIYGPPETRIARQQVARAYQVLDFLTSVRADSYATAYQKRQAIAAIVDLELPPEVVSALLALSDASWKRVRQETINVLDQMMRRPIREDAMDEAYRQVSSLISLALSDQEAMVVEGLVRGLLVPNTFYDAEATEAARQAAREGVAPVEHTLLPGEVILRSGEIVTDLDLEALEAVGLRQRTARWGEIGGTALLVLLTTVSMGLSIRRFHPHVWQRERNLALVAFLFVFFVLVAKVMMPGRTVLPYLFPAAALAIFVSVLLGPALAVIVGILLGAIVGFITQGSLELAAYVALGSLVAALVLERVERVNAFFWAGIYVALTNIAVVLAFRLPEGATDTVGMVTLVAVGVLNGALSASLTLAGLFVVGNLFDITTSLQLLELARPSHPLLSELLHKAPATYHHTVMVANLAEQAAERIGANPLLTRVGAFYHDIGKIVRPHFFSENQMDGVNIHDRLDPYTSAEILISHVTDGLELAKKYRLPSRVRAFIPEHHGTMRVSFMYQKALQEAGGDPSKVDEARFRYPGPKPQSKETAILMLADGCESAVRAARPTSVEEIEKIVRKIVEARLADGQLDECDLTLRELKQVAQSFVETLRGVYHPRVKYPEPEERQGLKHSLGRFSR
ncbi:MAG TPA: HDIG domain-containing protein [Chloroflexi bacterium]|nr:HDIG domain-containing protein [Chloroflexota bacterium]